MNYEQRIRLEDTANESFTNALKSKERSDKFRYLRSLFFARDLFHYVENLELYPICNRFIIHEIKSENISKDEFKWFSRCSFEKVLFIIGLMGGGISYIYKRLKEQENGIY